MRFPVHLLTRQAFALYWRHLKPDGVLAVHVSNRYLNLGPGVALAAAETGKQAMMVTIDDDDEKEIAASDWVLVSSRQGFFDQPEIKGADTKITPIPVCEPGPTITAISIRSCASTSTAGSVAIGEPPWFTRDPSEATTAFFSAAC